MSKYSSRGWKRVGALALWWLAACGGSSPPVTPASVPPEPDMAMAPAPPPPPPPAPNTTAAVSIMDNFFSPANVTLAPGGTVTWTWAAANSHTVTSNSGLFDSSPPRMSGTFQFTFPNAGTFPYHCQVHGFMMSGTVTVQ